MKHQPHQVYNIRKMQLNRLLAGMQILLLEDEFDVANLLLFIFEEAGAEVAWVMPFGDTLTRLDNFQPDVLVCNIKLPD